MVLFRNLGVGLRVSQYVVLYLIIGLSLDLFVSYVDLVMG